MSRELVTKTLSHITEVHIRFFVLVHCNVAEKSGKCSPVDLDAFHYLCFSEHNLIVVDRELRCDPALGGRCVMIPLQKIKRVRTRMPHDYNLLIIDFKEKVQGFPKTLYVRTTSCEEVLRELEVCWKTDHMFQNWQVAEFPLVNEREDKQGDYPHWCEQIDLPESWRYGANDDMLAFMKPRTHFSQLITRGYCFHARHGYKEKKTQFVTHSSLLKERWLEYFTPGGDSYYVHGVSRETTWIYPEDAIVELGTSGGKIKVPPPPKLGYQDRGSGAKPAQKKRQVFTPSYGYSDGKRHFTLDVGAPEPIMTAKSDIKEKAEQVLVELGRMYDVYRLVGSGSRVYNKNCNFTGDPARWEGWTIHCRLINLSGLSSYAYRDAVIVAMRRKYIPPTMDSFQDIVLVFFGPINESSKSLSSDPAALPGKKKTMQRKGSSEGDKGRKIKKTLRSMRSSQGKDRLSVENASMDLVQTAYNIAGSIFPQSRDYHVDRVVVESKANALLLSEEMYTWYQTQLQIRPKAVYRAQQFLLSLLYLLNTGKVFKNWIELRSSVFPNVEVNADQIDPLVFATLLEKESQDITDSALPSFYEAWNRRVWRYLAWCVDGGLLPNVMTLDILVDYYEKLAYLPGLQKQIGHLLEVMLHVHIPGQKCKLFDMPLVSKVRDHDTMLRFVFNESVMIRLLELEYIKNTLNDTGDPTEYPRFLINLLHRPPQCGQQNLKLLYVTCNDLIDLPQRSFDSKISQSLYEALQNLFRSPRDELKTLATKAFAVYTFETESTRAWIMKSTVLSKMAQYLDSQHEPLLLNACKLIDHCASSDSNCVRIGEYDVIPKLLNLLKRGLVEPYYRDVEILTTALSILGKLARDMKMKSQIVQSMGIHTDRNIPRSILILTDLLNDKDYRRRQQQERENEMTSLQTTLVVALKELADRNEKNKGYIARETLPELVRLTKPLGFDGTKTPKSAMKNPKSYEYAPELLLSSVIDCLYVLSFDHKSRVWLKANKPDFAGVLHKSNGDSEGSLAQLQKLLF